MVTSQTNITTDTTAASLGNRALRKAARLAQYVSVRLAHAGKKRPPWHREFDSVNLLMASRIARHVRDNDTVIDIGCNCGRRLRDLSLFRSIAMMGVDICEPSACYCPSDNKPELRRFDGAHVPLEDKSADVSLICYVLHHMSPQNARALVAEAARISRRAIVVIEDSLPRREFLYELRNTFHRIDSNLEFFGSDHERYVRANDMFLTHSEWAGFLSGVTGGFGVETESLWGYTEYRHNTMFVAHLPA